MQDVLLNAPRVIDGAVRYPVEGLIPVTDDEYDRLLEARAIFTDEDEDPADADELDTLKVANLKAVAEKEGADIGSVTRKDDIVAAIRAHRATPVA